MQAASRAAALWIGLLLVTGSCALADIGTKGEIVIASDFPTSGGIAYGGRPGEAGVAYALQLTGSVKGYRLVHVPYDDSLNGSFDTELGARNFAEMVSDQRVLGVVGPFNSDVARAVIPIANKAELAMISPTNTGTCLTQELPFCGTKPSTLRDQSKPNNYFRIAAPDSMQGPAMADFAYDVLKLSRAAVWSDSANFGKQVADNFTKRFEARGGTVVARQDFEALNPNKDFGGFLRRARDAGAQAIYAGALTGTGGCAARAQMSGVLDAYYLSADGTGDAQCIKDAKDQANDKMFFTVAAPDATKDPANKGLIDAFTKAFPHDDDFGFGTFAAYDCAKILIDAIGRAIDAAGGKMPTRRQVLDAVQNTRNIKLSTGTYSFDKNGDPISPTMVIYQLKNGVWTFNRQFPVAP